jgi:hypothetical protein
MKNLIFIVGVLLILSIPAHAANDLSQAHETWSTAEKNQPMPYLPTSKQSSDKVSVNISGFVSQQVNVNAAGQNTLNDAANEPSIAVNPLNPNQIVIGWRQFNNINSSFREAGLAYSENGGESWHNNGPLEPGVFRSDPVLAADADGAIYYQSLAVLDNNGQPGLQDDDLFRVDQWKSTNGGKTWGNKTNAIGGDKSWYAIDQSDGSNRGNFYAVWNLAGNNHYPKSFNYSVNNGMSFTSPVEIPKSPVYGTVAIGFDGEVYMAGLYGDSYDYGDLNLVKTNNPIAQMFPDFPQVTPIYLGGPMLTGAINPEGLLGQVWVATDHSFRHTRGNVYVLSSINTIGPDLLDVMFIRSRDDALTFSQPKRINDDGSTENWQWFGTMGVAPNGRIDVVWLDTRNSPSSLVGKPFSQLFYSYSYDGGLTFSKNQAISPTFNHTVGYPVQRKMGDYIDIVSDNKGAHVAYTGTFSGGQDVYYIHAKPAAFVENPYFPSHEMDGIWHNPAVPRQGIVSKTMVINTESESPQLINFDAVFTQTPTGQPTWFILQQAHPEESAEIEFVIYYPTGDLSENGTPIRPIGFATKSRIFDFEGELVKNKLQYHFDMTADAQQRLQNLPNFDLAYFEGNPFYQTDKIIEVEPIIAPEQNRNIHCLVQNLSIENPAEKNEGRVPVAYQVAGEAKLFMADFSYQKITDSTGNQTLVINEQGVATPTWFTMNSSAGDMLTDNTIYNDIYQPNNGNGFFIESDEDSGVTLVATETLTLIGEFELSSENSLGTVETFNPIAFNSFCGNTSN